MAQKIPNPYILVRPMGINFKFLMERVAAPPCFTSQFPLAKRFQTAREALLYLKNFNEDDFDGWADSIGTIAYGEAAYEGEAKLCIEVKPMEFDKEQWEVWRITYIGETESNMERFYTIERSILPIEGLGILANLKNKRGTFYD